MGEALDETDDEVSEVAKPLSKQRLSTVQKLEYCFATHGITQSTKTYRDSFPFEDWSDDDGKADYEAFKNRRTAKRKRAAAETNRLRGEKKSKAAQATSIVGRKPLPKKSGKEILFSTDTAGEDVDERDTFLDEPIPEYIEERKERLKKLHEAGLRYPPSYEGIDFLEPEQDEKPVLDKAVRTQRAKKDIILRTSGEALGQRSEYHFVTLG
jgi:hypothetical protein